MHQFEAFEGIKFDQKGNPIRESPQNFFNQDAIEVQFMGLFYTTEVKVYLI